MTYEKFVQSVAEERGVEADKTLRKELATMSRQFILSTVPEAVVLYILGVSAVRNYNLLIAFLVVVFYLIFTSTMFTAMSEDMQMIEKCKKFSKLWVVYAIVSILACVAIRLFLW